MSGTVFQSDVGATLGLDAVSNAAMLPIMELANGQLLRQCGQAAGGAPAMLRRMQSLLATCAKVTRLAAEHHRSAASGRTAHSSFVMRR